MDRNEGTVSQDIANHVGREDGGGASGRSVKIREFKMPAQVPVILDSFVVFMARWEFEKK